jgi:hypothetical protein
LSASIVPQMKVLDATLETGSNEAVALFELQVTSFTDPNSSPDESAPDTRSVTLPVQLDDAVKVIETLLTVVLSESTTVQSFPAESPAGSVVRKTSAHWLPSEPLLADADGLAVALAEAVGSALAEALGPAVASPGVVAALAMATPTPVSVARAAAMTAPLPRVRLRMGISFR